MGFILKGIKVIIGLVILFAILGVIFGPHNTTTPTTTTSKTAYTRDGVNFISKERVDENIKVGFAKPGDYKEVQVPLNTVVVGGYAPESGISKQEEQTTPSQQTQSFAPKQAAPASGTQVLSTDFGKIQIDIPYALTLSEDSSGSELFLKMPGAAVNWSIVTILLEDPHDLILEDFAAYRVGENYKYETVTTNDGHTMLFYAIPQGTQDSRTRYLYEGFIDHTKDKKVVVLIFAYSENYFMKVISTFSKDEFENVCKSFEFIN
jgi:hypothetical protein